MKAVTALLLCGALLWPGWAESARDTARSSRAIEEGRGAPGAPSQTLIRSVQEGLTKAGYYHGPVDGRPSPALTAAIRAYQKSIGFKVDGRITQALADKLATEEKVGALLQQLDEVRQRHVEEARQALLAQPSTRHLLDQPGAGETADPTRDVSTCFRDPTPVCLLREASESAKAVAKQELRDWALGELLSAQTLAGLTGDALASTRRIADPRLIMVALRDIAQAEAMAGRSAEAFRAVDIIPDTQRRIEALAALAELWQEQGRPEQAREATRRLLSLADQLEAMPAQVDFTARAAVVLWAIGDHGEARKHLDSALARVRSPGKRNGDSAVLRHLANALADMDQPDEALTLIADAREEGDFIPVQVAVAGAWARIGEMKRALAVARGIGAVRYRAVVLAQVAEAHARAGDVSGGRALLGEALAAAAAIDLPFARAYAETRIALALAEIGRTRNDVSILEQATITARAISDSRLKAHVLWTIAAERVRARDREGGDRTRSLAEKATQDMPDTLGQVWMFADLASSHAALGEAEEARAALRRGLDVAAGIRNSWGRARALSRLAVTLIEVREPATARQRAPE